MKLNFSAFIFLSKCYKVLQYVKITSSAKEKHLVLFLSLLKMIQTEGKQLGSCFITYSSLIPAQNMAICSFSEVSFTFDTIIFACESVV